MLVLARFPLCEDAIKMAIYIYIYIYIYDSYEHSGVREALKYTANP
jgi:hypothetical protein